MKNEFKNSEQEKIFEELLKRLNLKYFSKVEVNYDKLKVEFNINGNIFELKLK